MLTRLRNCEILKPIARILPKLQPNEFQPKLYFKIRSYITSKVELLQLIKTQLEVTDTNFRPIHEDNEKVNLRYAKWMSIS